MPRGLRRSEPAHPPVGSQVGSTSIMAPLAPDALDPGYITGTSNPAMKPGPYRDVAAGLSRPGQAHANPPPFTLGR